MNYRNPESRKIMKITVDIQNAKTTEKMIFEMEDKHD